MAAKKTFALRLDPVDANSIEEICSKNEIAAPRFLEKAVKEAIAREMRYLKGKEECRNALIAFLETGEVVDEDEMEKSIAEKLKSLGMEP